MFYQSHLFLVHRPSRPKWTNGPGYENICSLPFDLLRDSRAAKQRGVLFIDKAISSYYFVVVSPAGDQKPSIVWRKDGMILRNGHKYRVLQDGELIIKHAQYNDSGAYECVARTNKARAEAFTDLVVRGQY